MFVFILETYSPLDANLPFADDFHAAEDGLTATLTAENCGSGANQNSVGGGGCVGPTSKSSEMGPPFAPEREYQRIMDDINQKHREEEEINAILQDWKLLAQKVDYILFWVFLCLTTVSSCIFIFILPYFKRGKLL